MAAFAGFNEGTLTFLRELAENNDRTWFERNRGRYESELIAPARHFVDALGPGLREMDPALRPDARVGGSIFRMNRDLRFSADKRPYKDELAFRLMPDSAEVPGSGLYMRVRPDLIGFAAGVWAFSPPLLARFRGAVAEDALGPDLHALAAGLKVNGCRFTSDALRRVPKPWAEDHPRGDLLRLKGLIVGLDLPIPREFYSGEFVAWSLAQWERVLPVHQWLGSALKK